MGQSAIGMLRFITSPLLFLPFLHYLNAACVETKCETEDVVTMQLAMIATTTTSTTSTTLSAPKQTVTFKSKGGNLWPFVAKNFREAREEAHVQLHMKGWLQADKLCAADCTTANYDCCFQFFLVGSALSKDQTKDDDDVPDKGASLEVFFKNEENLDADVVNFVRTSGQTAEGQQASLKNLQDLLQNMAFGGFWCVDFGVFKTCLGFGTHKLALWCFFGWTF